MTDLARRLLEWYDKKGRRLPWRRTVDPYAIWVSEIMLQQTRVETVIPYFERWLERFPTVFALAEADEQEVLSAWEGLGYYQRARNLHRAARILVAEHGGNLPRDAEGWRRLPGVGRYTASALAAILGGQDEAAIDGNVKRVISRVYDIAEPVDAPAGEQAVLARAQENLPAGRAADYNQALMDLGALVCTPRSPRCEACPLSPLCCARAQGMQEQRPVTRPRRALPHYLVVAAVIRRDGKYLLTRRPSHGLLGGMWEFPGGKVQDGESLDDALRREIEEELGTQIAIGAALGVYRHVYSHFRITLHAFRCELAGAEPRPVQVAALQWLTVEEMKDYPMGRVDRRLAERLADEERTDLLPP